MPARELKRIAPHAAGGHADLVEQALRDALASRGVASQAVQAHGFVQDLGHRKAWVERGIGVLENDLQMSLIGRKFGLGQRQQVAPAHQHFAAAGLVQAQHRQAHRGFTRARFTHQTNRLAFEHRKAHVLDRHKLLFAKPGAAHIKHFAQVAHFEEGRVVSRLHGGRFKLDRQGLGRGDGAIGLHPVVDG